LSNPRTFQLQKSDTHTLLFKVTNAVRVGAMVDHFCFLVLFNYSHDMDHESVKNKPTET